METKFTKGEWIVAENHINGNDYQYTVLGEYGTIEVATVIRHNGKKVGKSKFKDEKTLFECKEAEANADLIADAGTTTNKCGLMPSELLKQRDELMEALKDIVDYWNMPQSLKLSMNDHFSHMFNIADKAIKKATE